MFQQTEQYHKYIYAPYLPTLTPHTLLLKKNPNILTLKMF